MYMFFLMLCIDAGLLILLLKLVNDDDLNFATAIWIALAAALGMNVFARLTVEYLGFTAVVLAAVIAATGVAVAISAAYGVEIRRAFIIGAAFAVLHIAAVFLLALGSA